MKTFDTASKYTQKLYKFYEVSVTNSKRSNNWQNLMKLNTVRTNGGATIITLRVQEKSSEPYQIILR